MIEPEIESLIDELITKYNSKKVYVVGIDGLGGAGKSTVSNILKLELENKGYKCYVLHIDDFIHNKHIRYNASKEEWYCYYNIQWRYDYLVKEILLPIKNGGRIDKPIELYDKENDNYILESVDIVGLYFTIRRDISTKRGIKNIFGFCNLY